MNVAIPTSYEALTEKYHELFNANQALSDAYVRLRSNIPGALNTNYAPTPDEIYTLTEQRLQLLLGELTDLRVSNEKLERKIAAMRKIVL